MMLLILRVPNLVAEYLHGQHDASDFENSNLVVERAMDQDDACELE